MPTGIEWTDETWNPVTGCTKVSQGCKHCYAERMSKRLAGRFGYPDAPNSFDVTLHPDRLSDPLKWRNRRKVFVCSMSDLFHPDVSFYFVDMVIAIIQMKYRHRFQILTKRPKRMREYFSERLVGEDRYAYLEHAYREMGLEPPSSSMWPMPWLWLGVSVENQEKADERIPILLDTPAAVRFVSAEPLLGPIRFRRPDFSDRGHGPGWLIPGNAADSPRIDWVIVGGESGPGARPMHPGWVRSIRDECINNDIAFFFKQWGAWRPKSAVDDVEHLQIKTVRPTKKARVGQNVTPNAWMVKVGKGSAGRELDGREWHQFPM